MIFFVKVSFQKILYGAIMLIFFQIFSAGDNNRKDIFSPKVSINAKKKKKRARKGNHFEDFFLIWKRYYVCKKTVALDPSRC